MVPLRKPLEVALVVGVARLGTTVVSLARRGLSFSAKISGTQGDCFWMHPEWTLLSAPTIMSTGATFRLGVLWWLGHATFTCRCAHNGPRQIPQGRCCHSLVKRGSRNSLRMFVARRAEHDGLRGRFEVWPPRAQQNTWASRSWQRVMTAGKGLARGKIVVRLSPMAAKLCPGW